MGRFLVIETNLEYRFYRTGKDNRPQVVVKKRLYNTSEEFFTPDISGAIEICPYRLESTQPQWGGAFVDPDITKAKLDVAKAANTQTTSKVGGFLDGIGRYWVGLLVAVMLVWGVAGGLVVL